MRDSKKKLNVTHLDKKQPDDANSPMKLSPGIIRGRDRSPTERSPDITKPTNASTFKKESPLINRKSPTLKGNSDFTRQQLAKKRKEQLEKKKRNYMLSNKINYSDTNLLDIDQILAAELLKSDDPSINMILQVIVII